MDVVYQVVCNDHRGHLLRESGCVCGGGGAVSKINASMRSHINVCASVYSVDEKL